MKERPILFRPEMVRAILEDRKGQTRRPMKPQPTLNEHDYFQWRPSSEGHNGIYTPDSLVSQCPYGKPGDRLWVREPFCLRSNLLISVIQKPFYKADGDKIPPGWRWTPSIHMPRVFCRLVLEIVNVRVERLQDIIDADAIAEGCEYPGNMVAPGFMVNVFRGLYESIHGPEVWDSNPWLWIIEFKKAIPA